MGNDSDATVEIGNQRRYAVDSALLVHFSMCAASFPPDDGL